MKILIKHMLKNINVNLFVALLKLIKKYEPTLYLKICSTWHCAYPYAFCKKEKKKKQKKKKKKALPILDSLF